MLQKLAKPNESEPLPGVWTMVEQENMDIRLIAVPGYIKKPLMEVKRQYTWVLRDKYHGGRIPIISQTYKYPFAD